MTRSASKQALLYLVIIMDRVKRIAAHLLPGSMGTKVRFWLTTRGFTAFCATLLINQHMPLLLMLPYSPRWPFLAQQVASASRSRCL